LVIGILIVLALNVIAICVYRWVHKRKQQQVLKDVVNNEVSKYFKIASNESQVEKIDNS
jgi:hypothetical protein